MALALLISLLLSLDLYVPCSVAEFGVHPPTKDSYLFFPVFLRAIFFIPVFRVLGVITKWIK